MNLDIRCRPLSPEESELVEETVRRFVEHADPGSFSVMSGARLVDGTTAFSVDVRSRKNWVCAEPVLIGSLITTSRPMVDFIVAVARKDESKGPEVISPCGSCREVLRHHAPDGWAAFNLPGQGLMAIAVDDLFPGYQMFP